MYNFTQTFIINDNVHLLQPIFFIVSRYSKLGTQRKYNTDKDNKQYKSNNRTKDHVIINIHYYYSCIPYIYVFFLYSKNTTIKQQYLD